MQILPVQGLDPENLEFDDHALERIDHIAEEYLPRSEEFIIKKMKENRDLPEPNPQNSTVKDYLQQLEMEGLLDAEILGEAVKGAAYLGHLDCLNTIIHSNRWAEISAEDLGWALQNAALNGHLDCLNAIIRSSRFTEISARRFRMGIQKRRFEWPS